MNRWTSGSRILRAAPLLLAVGILACGSDKKTGPAGPPITTVPTSWKGVWQLHTLGTLCGTNYILVDTTLTLNLCVGDTIRLPAGLDVGLPCPGGSLSATATAIHFSCSHALQDSCTGTLTVTLDLGINASAGTVSGNGRVNLDRTPNSIRCQDLCADIVFSGARLPNQEPTCPVPKTEWLGEIVPRSLWRHVH